MEWYMNKKKTTVYTLKHTCIIMTQLQMVNVLANSNVPLDLCNHKIQLPSLYPICIYTTNCESLIAEELWVETHRLIKVFASCTYLKVHLVIFASPPPLPTPPNFNTWKVCRLTHSSDVKQVHHILPQLQHMCSQHWLHVQTHLKTRCWYFSVQKISDPTL